MVFLSVTLFSYTPYNPPPFTPANARIHAFNNTICSIINTNFKYNLNIVADGDRSEDRNYKVIIIKSNKNINDKNDNEFIKNKEDINDNSINYRIIDSKKDNIINIKNKNNDNINNDVMYNVRNNVDNNTNNYINNDINNKKNDNENNKNISNNKFVNIEDFKG